MQTRSAMVRHGGVEKMCQGVCAEEIQVDGVWMRLRSFTGSWSNCDPIQRHPGQMSQFDLLPLAKPVNPSFHPVMICGHGDEDGKEDPKGQVAAVIPIELVEGDGADEADEEDSQPPSRETCADSGSLGNEAIGAPDHRFDLDDA